MKWYSRKHALHQCQHLVQRVILLQAKAGTSQFKHVSSPDGRVFYAICQNCFSRKKVDCIHLLFEEQNAFYEVIIRQAAEENLIDIFGVNTTTLHQTQELLRAANNKLALALDIAHIIPWHWDLQKHAITCDANRSPFELATGVRMNEEYGLSTKPTTSTTYTLMMQNG